MDTKLKSYNRAAGWGYGLLWLLLLFSTAAAGILSSITAAFLQIYRYNLDPDMHFGYYDDEGQWIAYGSKWTGEVTDPGFEESLTVVGLTAVGFAAAALVMLILICVFTGRYGREENGSIHLNWYDRIWSEIHIMSMLGFGAGFSVLIVLLYDVWAAEDWFRAFVSDYQDSQYFGMPNRLAVSLIVLAMIGAAVFCLTSLVSLVKKLKAGQFWEKSCIGGILLFVWRGVRGSDRTTMKIIGFMLLLCGIAGWMGATADWYNAELWVLAGAAVCLGLILLVVPGKTRKFKAIRAAAGEIRSGNLACKVPVNPGRSGRLDELDRLAVDLNHIGDAQQAAVASELKNQRMKTELISNVSHDLKTPLTSMAAYIDLLKKEGLDSPNAAEYLDIIDKKTQRLKVLTENLFEAAKASSGSIPVTISEIDLGALVSQSLAEMEEKLSARGLTAIVRNECEGQPEGCRVLADGQLLWRIIENVLGNVSKYALTGSRVYVNISRLISQRPDLPDRILLEVKNISAEPLNISADELMERFKRGDESRNTEGSGLGLAIARDLAALMHGEFDVSIDGDLFKSSVVLDEADSAQKIHAAESARPSVPDFPLKSEIAASAAEKKDAAVQAVRGAVDAMKEKAEAKKAEKAAKKKQTVEPLVVFEDIPIAEYDAVKEEKTN